MALLLNKSPHKVIYATAFSKHCAIQNVFRLLQIKNSINIWQYNTFVNSTDEYDILNIFGDQKKTAWQ